ncbi:hypothetical protein [Sphingobacterium faecium]|uniref:hypothetical protein n=1 Tax=Sphingobacterium faecium TaxID=34087 RepID=UPI00247ABB15|nr:hypothetical protein [Sphingobacterium faecium]WGQ14755.1 hypothetical protein QG727_22365 [Sphingobacterium faecium]
MNLKQLLDLGKQLYTEIPPPPKEGIIIDHELAYANLIQKQDVRAKVKELNIEECELFAYSFLIGYGAGEIQEPLRRQRNPNPFIESIILNLDRFLSKCESTNALVLYRQDDYSDVNSFRVNEIIKFNSYFVCSEDNFENSYNIIWIITPTIENSKGKIGHQIYDHGEEKQVTFERETEFLITKIYVRDGITYILCQEL